MLAVSAGPPELKPLPALAAPPRLLRYQHHDTPFGSCLTVSIGGAVHRLDFCNRQQLAGHLERLAARWPTARLQAGDPAGAAALARFITAKVQPETYAVTGTEFQRLVWAALLEIPPGQVCTYGDVALRIGRPLARRAVGQAVGRNPISLLIPCHRVVPASGGFGHYGSGPARKAMLLRSELGADAARLESGCSPARSG